MFRLNLGVTIAPPPHHHGTIIYIHVLVHITSPKYEYIRALECHKRPLESNKPSFVCMVEWRWWRRQWWRIDSAVLTELAVFSSTKKSSCPSGYKEISISPLRFACFLLLPLAASPPPQRAHNYKPNWALWLLDAWSCCNSTVCRWTGITAFSSLSSRVPNEHSILFGRVSINVFVNWGEGRV